MYVYLITVVIRLAAVVVIIYQPCADWFRSKRINPWNGFSDRIYFTGFYPNCTKFRNVKHGH